MSQILVQVPSTHNLSYLTQQIKAPWMFSSSATQTRNVPVRNVPFRYRYSERPTRQGSHCKKSKSKIITGSVYYAWNGGNQNWRTFIYQKLTDTLRYNLLLLYSNILISCGSGLGFISSLLTKIGLDFGEFFFNVNLTLPLKLHSSFWSVEKNCLNTNNNTFNT